MLFLGFGKPEPLDGAGLSSTCRNTRARITRRWNTSTCARRQSAAHRRNAAAAFVVDADLRPLPPPPAMLSFTARDAAAVLDGPRKGERVEFLRDAAGRIEWLRWDGRIARKQQPSA